MIRILVVALICVSQFAQAQHSWVYFSDKGNLSTDSDNPVNEAYVDSLRKLKIDVIGTSKWFNSACVSGCPTHLEKLSFVTKVEALGRYKITNHSVQSTQKEFQYGNSDWQLEMLKLDSFHRKGFTGKNVTIALFDGGFYKADTVKAFDSLWQNGRIKGYWDFLTEDTTIFWEYDGHGKYVLSIVGANWPDSIMGAAPDANFLLARTEEVNSEKRIEEFAWVKAMEWAADNGADIIHSSLGYSVFDTLEGDYTYADMDGKSTLITRATDTAFSKGIFVTNSAGNSGDDPWHYITAPCDGFHVLCVGSVDSNRRHSVFSSYGPSADGRVKPDVVAMGEGVTYINNQANLKTGNGTSFSGPLIAGFVACLKQAWPNMTNAQIYEAVVQSADRYTDPDTAYGYGLPDILKADSLLREFVSIERLEDITLGIYPIPANDFVNIDAGSTIRRIELVDVNGNSILVKDNIGVQQTSIDLTSVSQGVYVLRLTFMNGHQASRSVTKLRK